VITILKNGSRPISPVILNVFPAFTIGGSEIRFTTLVNSPKHNFRQLIFAIDGRYDCLDRIRRNAGVSRIHLNLARAGAAANVVAAYKTLRQLNPALLVTYNWGAIEWALAAAFTNIPYVHIVDGFGPEESERQLARRVWFRRLALARCNRIVVPSRTLKRLAKEVWRLPAARIMQISNGIDADRFARQPDAHLISALGIPRDRPIVGTVASLRPVKNITRLLQAVAQVAEQTSVSLVIVGDGAERRTLESQALAMGLSDTVIFTGIVDDPARLLGAFDVFVISSDTEQMPISVLEAMAAGLPIAGVAVGDIKEMVSGENRPFIVDRRSSALAGAMLELLSMGEARLRIGAANRERARTDFSVDRMVHAYTELYASLSEHHRLKGSHHESNAAGRFDQASKSRGVIAAK
jgi:glycosyltransferase involved in cell wall biosynthesis